MAPHNKVGTEGEKLAAEWLSSRGYQIVHRNWRHSFYEIDIIARKGCRLHFIEVKTRNTKRYGYPEESVSRNKFRHLKRAADAYLYKHPGHAWIQYDILSITFQKGMGPEYFLLEDVFL